MYQQWCPSSLLDLILLKVLNRDADNFEEPVPVRYNVCISRMGRCVACPLIPQDHLRSVCIIVVQVEIRNVPPTIS